MFIKWIFKIGKNTTGRTNELNLANYDPVTLKDHVRAGRIFPNYGNRGSKSGRYKRGNKCMKKKRKKIDMYDEVGKLL